MVLKIKNILNRSISYIQTDNGSEFSNTKFKTFCQDNGIVHRFTVPYTPQQNGRIERFNGTIIAAAKSLLNESRLSHHFWEYAVDTANYIHNRLPHRGINNRIPYEIISNSRVDYSHFKVFGCRVFFHIPKSFRNKFDNNAMPGIFLGYSYNPTAYKILDIHNNKIILSRTVDFFEDCPANSRISSPLSNNLTNFIPITDVRGSAPPYSEINQLSVNKRKRELASSPHANKRKKIIPKTYDPNSLIEPKTYKEIYTLQDSEEWLDAVQEELENMENLNVFTPIESIPQGSNIISSKWVFKYKKDDQGNITKRKARLVARGFSQIYGVDYDETFSPTLKQDSLRLFTAISVILNFKIIQIDINSAYLNAPLKETIYMKAPEGHSTYGKYYWKLNKALYGLKQAGREWNARLNKELLQIGFRRLLSEPCIYVKHSEDGKVNCMLSVYVDDKLIAGSNISIELNKNLIKDVFNIKEVGEVDFVIGIKFIKCKDGYILHQKGYIKELLRKFNINKCYPVRSPKPIEDYILRKRKFNETQYRGAIGNLLYLAISTRPDILFAVSKAARKNKNPTEEDWENVMRIFKYLKGTINYGIKFSKNGSLKVYVDADYAGDLETRKSTSGFLFIIGDSPTSWYSKLQHCVATSTTETEY